MTPVSRAEKISYGIIKRLSFESEHGGACCRGGFEANIVGVLVVAAQSSAVELDMFRAWVTLNI